MNKIIILTFFNEQTYIVNYTIDLVRLKLIKVFIFMLQMDLVH